MKPKLRDVEAHPIQHDGQAMILLRDPLGLAGSAIAVPRALGPLLALLDGTRDEAALEAALMVRAGVRLAPGLLARLLADLDTAYLLDNERAAAAYRAAVDAYRQAPFRPPSVGGDALADAGRARAYLQAFVDALPPPGPNGDARPIRGVISPHIDYPRGGPVYAAVWRRAAAAARDADLALVLGTDHKGGEGTLTLTRQSYATPWGVLPTDAALADRLAAALGPLAWAEELHHAGEHSIELAVNWLHFVRGGEPLPLLPILCGSFAAFVAGRADPAAHPPFAAALEVLRPLLAERRVLVVAAADLAHMGPAFGDRVGLDYIARAQLAKADDRLLATVEAGDAAAFFDVLRAERDRRHVCGLPPIYLALRLLGETAGEREGYALCPADPQGLSYVSIAGAVLF